MEANMSETSQVLAELAAIRLAVHILLGILVVAIVVVSARLFFHIRREMKAALRDMFKNQSDEMFAEDAIDGLIAFAQERIRKRPNDGHAHWYLARAYYQQENWSDALQEFNKVSRLEPSWINTHVKPYVEAIRRRVRADATE